MNYTLERLIYRLTIHEDRPPQRGQWGWGPTKPCDCRGPIRFPENEPGHALLDGPRRDLGPRVGPGR
jgi:hypothetical protein